MDHDNILAKLREIAGQSFENLNILEEQIDVNLQMAYFDFVKRIRNEFKPGEGLENTEKLFDKNTPDEEKKKILVLLASSEDVSSYRTIEKYLKDPDPGLKEWAILAFQESRMLLESSLLDENQIFISTGLGGKGSKLRYFIVLLPKTSKKLNETQQKIVKNEYDYLMKEHDVELEKINFFNKYVTMTMLIPLQVDIYSLINNGIKECNQFGDFLEKNFIVTNVKKLKVKEIDEFIKKNDQMKTDGDEPDKFIE